jgi:hypothetical protein
MVSCYTCGKVDRWDKMDCGHFQSRANYLIRWDKDNCRVQCNSCNIFRKGEQDLFGRLLEREIGKEPVDRLRDIYKSGRKSNFTQQDYIDMINHYEGMI